MDNRKFDFVIEPHQKLSKSFSEIWNYRELFTVLALRDFKVRYKQTAIGASWALIRPLLTTIVFTVIFSKVAGLPSQGEIPYALTVYVAMMPWFFFSSSFQDGSNSLVANANMVSKVYFPRIIVPISSLFVNFIDFCIAALILVALMLYFQTPLSYNFIFLPIFILLAIAITIATTLWMSALNVQYRDVRFVVPFIVQFGLYVSPVGFASETISNDWRLLYSLNPLVGVIDGFRWCILGQDIIFYWPGMALSVFITLGLLISGYSFFSKTERKFADVI